MAYITQAHAADHPTVWNRVSSFFAMVGRAMTMSSAMDARMQRVEALNSKTDAELAEMNLRREDITAYVFRDLMHL
ncbi:hypothetical protein [Tateyamaria pelophila]|uniref:hypothetical protein n=1 Tax=Tateyamaria pelophila TaxID=328415 RepID=UPI001CBD65E2|nr:hypothetical protein [Tateyamaria pelophila]